MSNILDVSEGKIALYAIGESNVYVDVVFYDENFWMTQRAIAELFGTTVQNVGQHINRIFEDEELTAEATIKKIFIVQKEGKREVKRSPDFYSLDMIIAVGYRVNSKQATRFRQWATANLKEYIQKGYLLYEKFRTQQDKDYISNFDKSISAYLRGNRDDAGGGGGK